MACRFFGGLDVIVEVCKVTFLPTGSHITEMKKMKLLFFKFLPLGNDEKNSLRPLPPTRKSLKPWIIAQVDIKMETEPLFSGDRNINTCTNL